MANVQGDQSVLTFSQLRQHPEAVIVAEINDKPVIFKLSQLLDQLFVKDNGSLDMNGNSIKHVGWLRSVNTIITSDSIGDEQEEALRAVDGSGSIIGCTYDDGGNSVPKIFFGIDSDGALAPLIRKSGQSGAPSWAPDFPGQMHITSTGVIYIAAGKSSASDWKKVTA